MFKFLSKKVFEVQPVAFGLDISDLTVKLAKLKMDRDVIKLASFGKAVLTPGLIEEGRIKKEEEVVQIIRQLFNEIQGEKLKTQYVIASLPEQESFTRVIQLPKMKEEELAAAIHSEVEANIPLKIDDLYLDWQIISSLSDEKIEHLDILISAVPKVIADPYVRVFKKLGLKIEALEIESAAIARSLIQNNFSEKPILIINFGATKTIFIIFSGSAIHFTSSLPISGTEPILDKLKTQVQNYISFYSTHAHEHGLKNHEIQKIILSGGPANLIGLSHYLSLELKIPVELGNSWTNILKFPLLKEIPEMSYDKSLEFTTAFGLALRGLYFKSNA